MDTITDYQTYLEKLQASDNGYLGFIVLLIGGSVLLSRSNLRFSLKRGLALNLPTLPLPYVLLIAFLIRLPGMVSSFWYDETFTGAAVKLAFEDLHRLILSDVHPPLWYILEWMVAKLSESEFMLRLPSLIFGVMCVYLIHDLALEFGFDRRVARTAALLLAIMPAHMWYSNEARGYTLLICLVWFLMLAILQDKPGRFLLSPLLPFLHAHGYIYIGILGACAILMHWRASWLRAALVSGLVSFLWLPVLYLQSIDVSNGFWLQPLTIGGSLKWIIEGSIGVRFPETVAPYAWGITILLTAYALWRGRKAARARLLYAVLGTVWGSTALISFSWHNIMMTRTLLPASLLVLILWADMLQSAPSKRAWRGALAPALIIGVIAALMPGYQRVDLRGWIAQCAGADYIHTLSTNLGISSRYYSDLPIYTQPDEKDRMQWLSADARAALGLIDAPPPSGKACFIWHDHALQTDEQRAKLPTIVGDAAPLTLMDRSIYEFKVYRLDRS